MLPRWKEIGQFLIKDVVLFAASIWTVAEALAVVHRVPVVQGMSRADDGLVVTR